MEDLIRGWDGEEVVVHHDDQTSSWMFIAVHSTVLGPAMGGTRLTSYGTPADALDDVLRLSGAMTLKHAAADTPFGGGKAVIAVPEVPSRGTPARRTLLLRHADLVESLHGTYETAADMNTGETDMDTVGERTSHVLGRSKANGGSGDPGAATALGVFHGIRASVRQAFGTDDLEGRSVLVQGLGSVGSRLVEHLHEGRGRAPARRPRRRTGIRPGDEPAPRGRRRRCGRNGVRRVLAVRDRQRAHGGDDPTAVPDVAGAANNQLAEPQDAELLPDAASCTRPTSS